MGVPKIDPLVCDRTLAVHRCCERFSIEFGLNPYISVETVFGNAQDRRQSGTRISFVSNSFPWK
jgi:hypothetical protein